MAGEFYQEIIKNLPVGYAYHRIILDDSGNPMDYEYLEVNNAFEDATGLNGSDIIGKKITEVLPDIIHSDFNWIHFYGNIALHNEHAEFDQYSEDLNRWYRIKAYSPKKHYFITLFTDITREKKDLSEKNLLLTTLHEIVFEVDMNFCFTNVITHDENDLFIPKDQIIGSDVRAVFSKDVANKLFTLYQNARNTGIKQNFEYKSPLPDDNRWFNAEIHFLNEQSSPRFVVSIQEITEKKDRENELQETKEYLNNLITYANAPIVTWSPDFKITEFNKAFEELTGRCRKEVLGKHLQILFPDSSKLQSILYLRETSIGERLDSVEIPILNASGDESIVLWNSANITTPDGQLIATIAQGQDITRRIKTENKLRTSEEKYRLIFTNAPLGIFHFDQNGCLTDCNDNFANIMGAPKEKLLGMGSLNLPNKNVVDAVTQTLNGKSNIFENSYHSFFGKKVSELRAHFAPVYASDHTILGGIGIVEDITLRKQMEKSLYIEKERLRTTLFSIGDGVISTDAQGHINLINKVAQNLTGWNQEEAFGKPLNQILNLIDEYSRDPCDNPASRVFESGEIQEINNHTLLISKDGREIPIEDSAAPIHDEEGHITGVVVVFRDFSEKKEKQEQIEYLSFHDHLTGLYNRRFFDEELNRLDTPRNLPLSLLIFDVNGLKLTNDAFGHLAGDRLLKKVADTMKAICRSDDIIARIGGDEFVILLPQTDLKDGKELAKRINSSLSLEKLEAGQVSISSGWSVKKTIDQNMSEVFKAAENKMYQYKISERNSTRNEAIRFIMKTLYEKLPREQEHSDRVSKISESIGLAMNLSNEEINELITAGALHDIGKIAISNEILNKTDDLNEYEWLEIRRHPEISYSILSSLNDYAPLANIILVHHERYDGTGYPKGLSGNQIPLQARIIAVADAFDAMTFGRPYKKPLSVEEAVSEIKAGAGSQFDPQITEIFLEVLAANQNRL
jgi:diguanylate cyclase (GGDEF)-like protein/PAS domain S-box-containing protein